MDSQCQYSAEIMRSSLVKIRILVVDDDSTSLLVVTKVLKKWNYEVMSGDNNECLMLKSLECGAAYFILKPVKPIDCKNIWQYAVASMIKLNTPTPPTSMAAASVHENLITPQPPTSNDVKSNLPSKPLKAPKDKTVKKPKVAWTNYLHNRFLQAINFVGIERAVPKKILELMNIPGLTRQNVASHLQKYRIFLKRVAEKGKEHQLKNSGDVLAPRPSLFTIPHPPSMITATRGVYPYFQTNQALSSSNQHGLHWGSSIPNDRSIVASSFASLEAPNAQARFNQQMVLGTANNASLSRSDMPSSRTDLLNNNPDLSQYSATSDFTNLTSSKPVFQNQSTGASQGLLTPTSLLNVNSGKPDFGLGNHPGSYGNMIRFLGSASPLNSRSSNNNYIANHQPSLGGMTTNNEVQINIGTNQLSSGFEDHGLLMDLMSNDQLEHGENHGYEMTGNGLILNDNTPTPQLKNGDLFNILMEHFPNLTRGGEEIQQMTPFSNGSNSHGDHCVGAIIPSDAAQDQENAPWDYEDLQQLSPVVPNTGHQQQQVIPGNDASHEQAS
ncbi:hypothetical protein CDL15_Pgr021809 [Punica granatum]|uniref:HTH myb-type domain-containing protein n=1 Tax=Punica granatum TaxID=22663 RepID=A0A218WS12_PUNGR|nr:hypothetical protein CDL15_Pgr021809 [Punica granatum]